MTVPPLAAPDRSEIDLPSPATWLQVRDLTVTFPGADGQTVHVVEGLSFTADARQMVCLAGRSGSGKTSALRRLAGLSPTAPDTVLWEGRDLSTLTENELAQLRRTRVACLDQDAGLVADLTCLENVLLPLTPEGRARVSQARPAARALLTELGLGKRLRWRPAQMSGGERQRTVLARALTSGAPAILADEPTASLDRQWADQVISRLRDHADRGGLVVAASHDPGLADASDVVVRLEG